MLSDMDSVAAHMREVFDILISIYKKIFIHSEIILYKYSNIAANVLCLYY